MNSIHSAFVRFTHKFYTRHKEGWPSPGVRFNMNHFRIYTLRITSITWLGDHEQVQAQGQSPNKSDLLLTKSKSKSNQNQIKSKSKSKSNQNQNQNQYTPAARLLLRENVHCCHGHGHGASPAAAALAPPAPCRSALLGGNAVKVYYPQNGCCSSTLLVCISIN